MYVLELYKDKLHFLSIFYTWLKIVDLTKEIDKYFHKSILESGKNNAN